MPIVFSDHAKEKSKKRNISKNSILQTISNPEQTKTGFRGRKLRQRRFGDKILRVITYTAGSKITVVTCYYLRRKKYEN